MAEIFKHGSPFTLAQRARMQARLKSQWLEKHRNRVVMGSELPDYVKPLPAGWALEDGVGNAYIGRLYVLRYRAPQRPKKPRYRVSASLADGWRTVSDSELRSFGENPEDYQPGPAFPPLTPFERLRVWFASFAQ